MNCECEFMCTQKNIRDLKIYTQKHPKKNIREPLIILFFHCGFSFCGLMFPLSFDLYEQFQIRYQGRVPALAWKCLSQFVAVPDELLACGELSRPWELLPLAKQSQPIHHLLQKMGFRTTLFEFLQESERISSFMMPVQSPVCDFSDPQSEDRWRMVLSMVDLAPKLQLESVADHFSTELARQIVNDFL